MKSKWKKRRLILRLPAILTSLILTLFFCFPWIINYLLFQILQRHSRLLFDSLSPHRVPWNDLIIAQQQNITFISALSRSRIFLSFDICVRTSENIFSKWKKNYPRFFIRTCFCRWKFQNKFTMIVWKINCKISLYIFTKSRFSSFSTIKQT